MDPNTLWHFQELFKRVAWIAEQIICIEQKLDELSRKLSETPETPTTRIDKIEYNFEQLKVERLDGTLLIGVTQGVEGKVDEFSLGDAVTQDLKIGGMPQEGMFPRLFKRLQRYYSADIHSDIDQSASKYGLEADMELRSALIDDLQKQTENRIFVHMKELQQKEGEDPQTEELVYENVVAEIRSALELFFEKRSKEPTS